ncbi:MAG: hypothetical protein WBQ32_06970 [Ignavibacteriaceae bacterium]
MVRTQKRVGFESKLSLLISVLIHGFTFWIFVLLEYQLITSEEPVYLEILFDEVTIKIPKEEIESVQKKIMKAKSQNSNEMPGADTLVNSEDFIENKNDTTLAESEYGSVEASEKEKRQMYLKYARTLLDSFLITHPEYSSLILKQQAKELVDNKFSRLNLEDKIAHDIYLYLKEKYPEGSEHEMNKYAGPGVQIPIDDLIELIKDLF